MAPPRPYLLVVDDWMDTADSLTQLLTVWGYDVESRYCGESALVAATTRRPQAILLDVGMPRMSGFEFITRFRELPGCVSAAIILVSGHTDATTRTRAREMGIAHYLIKPADPSEIQTLLETLTRWGRNPAEVDGSAVPMRQSHGDERGANGLCTARFATPLSQSPRTFDSSVCTTRA